MRLATITKTEPTSIKAVGFSLRIKTPTTRLVIGFRVLSIAPFAPPIIKILCWYKRTDPTEYRKMLQK